MQKCGPQGWTCCSTLWVASIWRELTARWRSRPSIWAAKETKNQDYRDGHCSCRDPFSSSPRRAPRRFDSDGQHDAGPTEEIVRLHGTVLPESSRGKWRSVDGQSSQVHERHDCQIVWHHRKIHHVDKSNQRSHRGSEGSDVRRHRRDYQIFGHDSAALKRQPSLLEHRRHLQRHEPQAGLAKCNSVLEAGYDQV